MPRYRDFIISLILCLVFIDMLAGQNYLWPTNASNLVSSSFCEFREGHYHSGIDIKTWLRAGFPCYAVADGYIERIRVSPDGYGKAIYLKLSDGNTAVYAHLQRFAKPVETIIRRWQTEHQSYSLDLSLDSVKFKQGEVIAYNGGTGTGPPHLHFEIRNPLGHPVNPLQYYPQHQDPLPPGIKGLICIPLSAGATINGSYLPQEFSCLRSNDGIYTLQQPVRIRGSVGLGIKGFDQAVALGNSFGFYQTLLLSGPDTVFNIRYDEFDFDQTAYINSEIYYPKWSRSGEVYHKLYIDDYNPLGFYPGKHRGAGIITAGAATVSVSILVKDFKSNTSLCRLEFHPDSAAAQLSTANSNTYKKLKQEPDFYFLGSDLVLRFDHWSGPGTIKLESGQMEFPVNRVNGNHGEVFIPGNIIAGRPHHLELHSLLEPVWAGDTDMQQLYPGVEQTLCWFDSALVITVPGQSVADTILITADTASCATVNIGLPVAGPLYRLLPRNFPWYAGFMLQLRAGSFNPPAPGKWAVYQIESSGKIKYLPSQFDSLNLTLCARAAASGDFLIACDTLPPLLDVLSPQNGQEYANKPRIKIKLDDLHSGIGSDQDIALSMDGNFVIPEWDPENKIVITDYDPPLSPGAHVFTASLKDRCGNSKRQAVYFTIKKPPRRTGQNR